LSCRTALLSLEFQKKYIVYVMEQYFFGFSNAVVRYSSRMRKLSLVERLVSTNHEQQRLIQRDSRRIRTQTPQPPIGVPAHYLMAESPRARTLVPEATMPKRLALGLQDPARRRQACGLVSRLGVLAPACEDSAHPLRYRAGERR
jgi:hypothetical protein